MADTSRKDAEDGGAAHETGRDSAQTGSRLRQNLGTAPTLSSGELAIGETLSSDPGIPVTRTPSEPNRNARDAELEAGTLIDGTYRVEARLGAGGMGAVYVVEHVELGKKFAAKVVTAALADDAASVERLRQEARALSAIDHENIVSVSHLGRTEDGLVYVIMELLKGEDLGERISRQVLAARAGEGDPWLGDDEVRTYVPQILTALTAAHQAGVVHRDLKPDNIFLSEKRGRTTAKVVDFGISKIRDSAQSVALTQTGQILGTPLYMAPEQSRSTAKVDARADLYSFGCILYEMVTGRVPFPAENPYECVVMHTVEEPKPPSLYRPDLRPAVEALILRCMQKKPGQRFGSALDLLDAWARAWGEDGEEAVQDALRHSRPPMASDLPAMTTTGPQATLADPTGAHVVAPPGRPRWLTPLLAVVALSLAVGVGFAMAGSGAEPTPAPPPTAGARETPSEPAPPAEPTAPAEPAEATAEATAPAEDATVSRHLVTDPEDAEVYLGETLLGRTPLDVEVPAGGRVTVELRHRARRTTTQEVAADGPAEVRVTLPRRSSGGRGTSRPTLAPL